MAYNPFKTFRTNIGTQISLLGNIASRALSPFTGGQELRIGGGQGLGSQIAGTSFPLAPTKVYAAPPKPTIPQLQPQTQTRPTTTFGQLSQPRPAAPPPGGGGGQPAPSAPTDGGGGTPDLSSLFVPQPQAQQIDFDALIGPAIQGLESAIGPLQQQATSDISSLQAQQTASQERTKAETAAQEATIGRLKGQQTALGESAADRARRAFAEIQQGLQARYGRSTGTGAFAAELAGRETLRNLADIHGQVSQAIAGLDDKLIQVREVGRIMGQDIENQTRDLVAKAKNNLELQLAEIRRQKGEIQSRKAELASQAIQLYQNSVNQVNSQNAAFKQNLFLQMQDAENKIRLQIQKGQDAINQIRLRNINIGRQTTPASVGKPTAFSQPPTGGGSLNLSEAERERLRMNELAGFGPGG